METFTLVLSLYLFEHFRPFSLVDFHVFFCLRTLFACFMILEYWTFLLYSVFSKFSNFTSGSKWKTDLRTARSKFSLSHTSVNVSFTRNEFIPITRCNANVMFSVEAFFSTFSAHPQTSKEVVRFTEDNCDFFQKFPGWPASSWRQGERRSDET